MMGRPKRIRRRLSLPVSEPQPANPHETWTPGARFATGWGRFVNGGALHAAEAIKECRDDPIQIAGFLAAHAAWDAHYYAVNWMEIG
jgi:hypothetical protein